MRIAMIGMMCVLLFPFAHGRRETPKIQIALLLDTSGSMDGLLEQAKTRLWQIVNDLALSKKGEEVPALSVALFEYGKSSLPESDGYLRVLVPLTDDLDKVSEALFELTTNGGEEYCGQVIRVAAADLDWDDNPQNYKAIFIAGNEPFNQGSVNYKKSCADAIARGIIVNTIFCGTQEEGIRTFWKDGADLADGKYMTIDHNRAVVEIKAPQDTEILRLGQRLNETYLAYGKLGRMAQQRQKEQDGKALGVAEEVAVLRTLAKATPLYEAETWDLVDAAESGLVDLDKMDDAALPESMKSMDKQERAAFLDTKTKEREELQERLGQLRAERKRFIANQRQETTLDAAILAAVRAQLKAKSFVFDD